jgi:hypothetical protein
MNLKPIKNVLRSLSLSQLRKLDQWLHELIRRAEDAAHVAKPSPSKKPVADQTLDNRTYRHVSVRCGKEKCKCARGKLHGPYWYSYTRVKDKVKSQYIGKRLPPKVERELHKRGKT